MNPLADNKTPLLTIAIPTYNRSKYLDLCLSGIFQQGGVEKDSFQVIVSDNCSTDGTTGIVEKYAGNGWPLRYVRNPENIGATANVARCYGLADTKYVLIIGDDDVLLDGALAKIIRVLSGGNYGVVHLGTCSYEKDHLREKPLSSPSGVRIYADSYKFFRDVNFMFTFISANVINKRSVPAGADPLLFVKTEVSQLAWTIPAALHAEKNAFIRDHCVSAKRGNTGGYRLSEVFGVTINEIFDYFIGQGAPRANFDVIRTRLLTDFFPVYIVEARQHGKFKPEDYFESISRLYGKGPRFWLFVVPVIKLPLPAAIIWRRGMTLIVRIFRKLFGGV